MDFAVPADHRVKLKESEKKDKYLDLAKELKNYGTWKWRLILVLYSRNTNISGSIIKHNLRTSMNERNTFIYKNISLTLYSRKDWCFCVRDGRGDIYSERGLLLPISSSRSQGVPTLAPPWKLVRDASVRVRVSRSTAILCTLSIFWPRGSHHVVSFWLHTCSAWVSWRPLIFLFTNQKVTACQSTRGHSERTENPWHML